MNKRSWDNNFVHVVTRKERKYENKKVQGVYTGNTRE